MSTSLAGAISLSPLDIATIAAYFAFCICIGIFLKRRAERKGLDSYIVADRNLPWWLIGTSMVAATFAADTPLLVSNWVYQSGIANNWEWWCFLPGAMLTTFLFARLWRRTEVLTDAEYVTLRYGGAGAHLLRAYRALYMGFVMNTLVIGTQFVVSGKFGTTLMGVEEGDPNYENWRITIALVCGLVAMFYSSLAGIAGIVINDFVQFTLAMIGALLVAYFALAQPEVGGLDGLVSKLTASHPEKINFLPPPGDWFAPGEWLGPKLVLQTVLLFLTIRWWAQVYGGAEPGGASHVAQRMLSARSEKHALFGTLWFNVAHYAVRPWPWILTGLACLFIFPGAADGERAYIRCINFVPAGLKGLVLAGFFSALMAIDTRLNMGSAYFVNDFYRPYIARNKSDRHYVNVARLTIVVQMLLGAGDVQICGERRGRVLHHAGGRIGDWNGAAAAVVQVAGERLERNRRDDRGAGECAGVSDFHLPGEGGFQSARASSAVDGAGGCDGGVGGGDVSGSSAGCATTEAILSKGTTAGPLWGPVARAVMAEDGVAITPGYRVGRSLLCWIVATCLVYCMLFGTGKLLLGQTDTGLILVGCAAGLLVMLIVVMRGDASEEAPLASLP